MGIQSLQQFGAVFLAPVLSYFNQHLLENTSAEQRLYFLAREGYWLERSFSLYAQTKQLNVDSRYLLVSRAFLFKIGLLKPLSYSYSLNFRFKGSLAALLEKRFMLTEIDAKKVFTDKELSQNIILPRSLKRVSNLFEQKIEKFKPLILPSFEAYSAYLDSLDFFAQKTLHLVDVGYSGTIQSLLSLIFDLDSVGHYLIASKSGYSKAGNLKLEMKGYLKEGVSMGKGYVPLDRSMFLEGLLTAPMGQFQDIRFSPLEHKSFEFCYGRKVASQHQFHLIETICQGALTQLAEFAANDIQFYAKEIESLYTSFVTKKGMLPTAVWPLFEIDDDVANEGTVQGIDFFGLRV